MIDGKLYIALFSIHGLIRGENLELGRDADTGGQTKYVVELARALGNHPMVAKVDLFTRLVQDPKVDLDYSKPEEEIGDNAHIVRIPFGPKRYLRKEVLWNYLDEFMDRTLKYFRTKGLVPDILHGHYADAGLCAASLGNLLGVPTIFTGHSLGREKNRLLLDKGMSQEDIEKRYNISTRIEAEEQALDTAMFVVASTSQEIEKQYSSYENYRPKQMRVVPPGTDLKKFYPPKSRWKLPAVFEKIERFLHEPKKPVVLAISRADERKNINTLIQAYGENARLQEMANLVVVAGNRKDITEMDKGARRVLKDMLLNIDKFDLYGKVAYPKQHKPDDVPDFYRMAAQLKGVFINPALTEPFGLTLIEAAACGLPIVATDDGGPQEIIGNCENGFLIDPLNREDISKRLIQTLADKDQWRKWSNAGIRGVKKHYSWESHADKYIKAIKKEVGGRKLATNIIRSKSVLPTVKKLIITDIDNTLLGDEGAAKRFVEFLEEHKDTVGFGVATGRSLDSAVQVLKEWNIKTPDVYITSVGSEINYGKNLVADTGWRSRLDWRWKPDEVKKVMADIPGLEFQPEQNQREHKISFYYDPKKTPGKRRIMRMLREKDLNAKIIMSHGEFLDILPVRSSKGQAVRYVSMKWGVPMDHILVAGDSGNDEDMINGNLLGVVVGNHSKELAKLKGRYNVYFAEKTYADGIIEGVNYYDLFGVVKEHEWGEYEEET
ncbi:HAD-IIB family hydrolase [Limisalsivibrio acetivorans]|uniref:HAD-IIB family hydrolase n=1 Tax=Limisalsivibrio acetivorans TaxID=1304888 RepID=UPI0003B5B6E8|nr:HAD-IIB family hydrolase [Limisalsivibrio acetivorans]